MSENSERIQAQIGGDESEEEIIIPERKLNISDHSMEFNDEKKEENLEDVQPEVKRQRKDEIVRVEQKNQELE